jgi:hypothetical protein
LCPNDDTWKKAKANLRSKRKDKRQIASLPFHPNLFIGTGRYNGLPHHA